MQEKLSDFDVQTLERARSAILAINWKKTSEVESYWSEIYESLCGKIRYGTSDGRPLVEPELTDQDACCWPRRLVMVRDNKALDWKGPFYYIGKSEDKLKYATLCTASKLLECWHYARPATPEEIKEAGL